MRRTRQVNEAARLAQEHEEQLRKTAEDIRKLDGLKAKMLLEYLIEKNEITGVLVHSKDYVDSVLNKKIGSK